MSDMSVVNENGKIYTIDDETGLIIEASLEEVEALDEEFRLGHRVEVAGKVGEVISIIPSVYGAAFGVKFDDGAVDEFAEQQLKRTSVEKQVYDSPIQEIFARYEQYEQLPGYTEAELETRAAEARWINLRASSLQTYTAQGGIRDPKLDQIILVTGSDLKDIKDVSENAGTQQNQRYLRSFNQYSIAEDVGGMSAGLGVRGDASWLDTAIDGMEVVETTDTDLAVRATEVVSQLTKEQLEDDEFMSMVASFQNDYLRNDEGREKKFASYLEQARKERVKDLPSATDKVAASHDELRDVSDSALYI